MAGKKERETERDELCRAPVNPPGDPWILMEPTVMVNWSELSPAVEILKDTMPFKSRARVILRNDTDRDAMNYSHVEWESLPAWDEELGCFHATYARQSLPLTKDSRVTFFKTEGRGHILGRQFSVVSQERNFEDFNTIMEGNHEVDIDGQVRRIDYPGTEDSFPFSWGFNESFAGLRAGMP